MSEKSRLKYEKPVSIDMGRVAPVLGAVCSIGNGPQGTCNIGYDNTDLPTCQNGPGPSVVCNMGTGPKIAGCYEGATFGTGLRRFFGGR